MIEETPQSLEGLIVRRVEAYARHYQSQSIPTGELYRSIASKNTQEAYDDVLLAIRYAFKQLGKL